MIGDWNVAIKLNQPNGKSFEYKAKWHNYWMLDGYAVMQEWRGPYSTGAEMRYYHLKSKTWTGRNLYVPGSWKNTYPLKEGDRIIIGHDPKKDSEGNTFNTREVYSNITENSFKLVGEISKDGGKTWKPGRYLSIATRSVNR